MRRRYNLVIIASLLFLSACVATPDEGVVQSKEHDIMEIIESTANPETQMFPERYTLSGVAEHTGMIFNVDAIVETEDDTYPVYSLERYAWTEEDVERMLPMLIGDRTLYYSFGSPFSYSQDTLLYAIAEERENVSRGGDDRKLRMYEGAYPTAPATRYDIPAELEFRNISGANTLAVMDLQWEYCGTLYGQVVTEQEYEAERSLWEAAANSRESTEIYGIADLGDGMEAMVGFRKTEDKQNVEMFYARYNWMEALGYAEPTQPELTITAENAAEMAAVFLDELGVSDMRFAGIEEIDEGYEYMNGPFWNLLFVRSMGTEILSIVDYETNITDVDIYSKPLHPEYIRIGVRDDGVVHLQWQSPSVLKEELNENVSMQPFDEIMEIFAQQFENNYAHVSEYGAEYITKREYTIDRIALNYMTVARRNSDEYLVIPVWDFFGSAVYTYSDDYMTEVYDHYILDENNQRIVDYGDNFSFLTINAIDGTVIDRALGY